MKYGHLPTPRNHSLQQSSQTVLAPVGIVASHPVAPATGHVDSIFGEAPSVEKNLVKTKTIQAHVFV